MLKSTDAQKHFVDFKRIMKYRVKPLDSEKGYLKEWRSMLIRKGVPKRDA